MAKVVAQQRTRSPQRLHAQAEQTQVGQKAASVQFGTSLRIDSLPSPISEETVRGKGNPRAVGKAQSSSDINA